MLPLLCWLLAAYALTPPPGWSLVSSDRALRNAADPLQGELIALPQPGGAGAAEQLASALLAAGLPPQQTALVSGGRFSLVLADGRLGQAAWDAGGSRWVLLLASPAYAAGLNPDSTLATASQPAAGAAWGVAAPPAESAGVWGAQGSAAPASSGWISGGETGWIPDPRLVGEWEASAMLKGQPARLRFRFAADGTVTLSRERGGRSESFTGRWGTHGGQLLLELPGSSGPEGYTLASDTLSLMYESNRLTLYKK